MPNPIVSDLADMMADTIIVESDPTDDGFGNLTYATTRTIRCHLTSNHKLVKDASGKETMSTVQAILAGYFDIDRRDQVTLPARYSPRKPPIINVIARTDENGPHHETIMM